MGIKRSMRKSNFALTYEVVAILVVTLIHVSLCAEAVKFSFVRLDARSYVQDNTKGGCVRFPGLDNNSFSVWESSSDDCLLAIQAARHFIRYGMAEEIPMSYYEEEVCEGEDVVGSGIASNTVQRAFRLNLDQFEPPVRGKYGNSGIKVHEMQPRVLSFIVQNPSSKSPLYCILVAFFQMDTFMIATYFNINTGKVVLDFHQISQSGGMLLASESRYPYLTAEECAVQDKIISSLPLQNSTIKVSNLNGAMATNTSHESDGAYLEIKSACPVIRHPLLNGGMVGAGEFLGFSFGASKNINASNFETNGNSLVVCKSLDHPYMEWFDRVSLWYNQGHRLYRIDVQGQMPEDFPARQRYGFYNALTNNLGKGFGVNLTRLPYRSDMPYGATGTVAHLQFHVNIGRKNCRMSIVSQASYKKPGRGSVTLSDDMIKINTEDL